MLFFFLFHGKQNPSLFRYRYRLDIRRILLHGRPPGFTDRRKAFESTITFKDAGYQIIARKKIDYSKSAIHPDFVQEDLRDGCIEGAESKDGQIELTYRKNSKKAIQRKLIAIPEPAVVDAGFNNFVKDHWEEIGRGKTVKFYFALPCRLDYFAFRLSREEKMISGKAAVVFKMEPDNFVLRNIVSPVMLTYNAATKRLMQYEGLSNINDRQGRSYNVKIIFPVIGP